MEKVTLLIRDLVLIVVITALLDLLLPVGEMRRYVRMVMGILVLVAILQVFAGFVYRAGFLPVPAVTNEPPLRSEGESYESFRTEYFKRAAAAYREGVAKQVRALARLAGLDVSRVDVVLEENREEYPRMREIRLYLDSAVLAAAGSTITANNVTDAIADFYNLPRERVVIAAP